MNTLESRTKAAHADGGCWELPECAGRMDADECICRGQKGSQKVKSQNVKGLVRQDVKKRVGIAAPVGLDARRDRNACILTF
jgi:hypothetical protein